MRAIDLIIDKRNGLELSDDQIRFLIDQYTRDKIPDYQMSAFLMAVYFNHMSSRELATWTNAMLHSGEVFDLSDIPGPKIDKHSTGGVGDKISLVLAPLAVAAGLKVPMISGRGLGHTGGTLDKLEAIPGFNISLSYQQFKRQIEEVGCVLIGQTEQVAPADKRLYALRDVTGTVESIPLISSSILSKKLAEGIDALVLDVKVGTGAFMKELNQARELAQTMINLGKQIGTPVRALITDMNQPLGHTIGNALEVREAIETLQGKGPSDIVELSIELALEMLVAADTLVDEDQARSQLLSYLNDGTALGIFAEIIERQGGDTRVLDDPSRLSTSDKTQAWTLTTDGVITNINTTLIGLAAMELGAGRATLHDTIEPGVGIDLHTKCGDVVEAGDPILTIYYNDTDKLQRCKEHLVKAFTVGDSFEPRPLIFERLS